MNQTEIDELRRLHEAATPAPWSGTWNILTEDGDHIARTDVSLASDPAIADNDGPLIVAARNVLPRLLAALEEARAERSEARSLLLNGIQTNGDSLAFLEHVRREHAAVVAERDALKAKLYPKPCGGCPGCGTGDCVDAVDAAETQAWDALGRPDGTHDTTNVQRLCEAHGALKATLAKHAESERAWCELATARGAKVAALESSLAEMSVKLDEGIECYPSSPCNIFATLLELHGLWRGKPSAKAQP